MRQGLQITDRERKQVERALQKLDRKYSAGKMDRRLYMYQRGQLLANLERPRFNETNLSKNAKGWWKRNEVNHSPAPVGYWDRVNNGQRKASQNKIRASMISFCDNGYWNTDNFQEAIRTASNNAAAINANNEVTYFEETVMASENLGSTQIWSEIAKSPQVTQALKRLSNTIDSTIKSFMRNGLSEASAKAIVREEAIRSGRALTEAGYDAENAAQVVKAVMCGEMNMHQAINHVTENLNETSKAVANAPSNSTNDSSTMNTGKPMNAAPAKAWNNGYDIYNMSPDGGPSLAQLQNALNQLQNDFDLTNNPVERNEISYAMDNLQRQINARQEGINSISTPTSDVNSVNVPSQSGGGYDPRQNYRANQSTMQETVKAMANGPSLSVVVKDIFTVRSNIYFDWTAGGAIEFLNNGTFKNANNSSNSAFVYPSGEWTVFANSQASLPTLRMIAQSLEYATASPLWSDADRAYLEYLKTVTATKISEVEAGVLNNTANTNAANNNTNNANSVNTMSMNVNNTNNGNNGNNMNNYVNNTSELLVQHRGYTVTLYDDLQLGRAVKIVSAVSLGPNYTNMDGGSLVYRQSFDALLAASVDPHDASIFINFIDGLIQQGAWPEQGGMIQ